MQSIGTGVTGTIKLEGKVMRHILDVLGTKGTLSSSVGNTAPEREVNTFQAA